MVSSPSFSVTVSTSAALAIGSSIWGGGVNSGAGDTVSCIVSGSMRSGVSLSGGMLKTIFDPEGTLGVMPCCSAWNCRTMISPTPAQSHLVGVKVTLSEAVLMLCRLSARATSAGRGANGKGFKRIFSVSDSFLRLIEDIGAWLKETLSSKRSTSSRSCCPAKPSSRPGRRNRFSHCSSLPSKTASRQ